LFRAIDVERSAVLVKGSLDPVLVEPMHEDRTRASRSRVLARAQSTAKSFARTRKHRVISQPNTKKPLTTSGDRLATSCSRQNITASIIHSQSTTVAIQAIRRVWPLKELGPMNRHPA
jgi:hypothetical protein